MLTYIKHCILCIQYLIYIIPTFVKIAMGRFYCFRNVEDWALIITLKFREEEDLGVMLKVVNQAIEEYKVRIIRNPTPELMAEEFSDLREDS